jgi:hypothetical protein
MPVRLVPAALAAVCLTACSAPAALSAVAPSPSAAGVDWARFVRSCAVADGGSGLGTIVDGVVRGDVTGDGRADALVIDECQSSTSAWPQEVEVFDGASDPSAPRLLGTLLADDQFHPRSVVVTVGAGGRVTITGIGLSDTAPLCCPDLTIRRVYTWSGTGFTLVESAQGRRPT